MTRLLVETVSLDGGCPRLNEAALRHLKVLRIEEGEKIELFDGNGAWRHYVYAGGGMKDPIFKPIGEKCVDVAPKTKVVLFACVTKGSRWDWTIEKAVELGVSEIVPVISQRTIVRLAAGEREAKRERWQRVADDAVRQCASRFTVKIHPPVDFVEALTLASQMRTFVGALCSPPPPDFFDLLSREKSLGNDGRALAAFIGPEGDFTPEELSSLLEVADAVSFGPNVLRAETAAIYALSILVSAARR